MQREASGITPTRKKPEYLQKDEKEFLETSQLLKEMEGLDEKDSRILTSKIKNDLSAVFETPYSRGA